MNYRSPAYPDYISGGDICHMEGHDYGEWGATCASCGDFNGALFAYQGRVARNAKRWGVDRRTAMARTDAREQASWECLWGLSPDPYMLEDVTP